MISVNDFFKEVRECDYKGEHYSVRDNGAVMRHPQEGKRLRKYDNVWTFGNTNTKTGYNYIASNAVHRIVAFAFLGLPPTPQHVVDHIDTNKQNNRPDNLRWVTRLENVLDNPITRARIENICGSIEVFLKDPSVLRGHEKIDPNFYWMRAVSPNEARISREKLIQWAKERPASKGGNIGEWLFDESKSNSSSRMHSNSETPKRSIDSNEFPIVSASEIIKKSQSARIPETEIIKVSNETDSLTPNVIQVKWRTPTEFPLCPQEKVDNPLIEYQTRLTPGSVFCHNQYQDSLVLDTSIVDNDSILYVMSKSSEKGAVKPWALCKITYKDGIFYHENNGSFFKEDGVQKFFTLAQGKEWTGGTVFDELV